jgi:hypothetical protein
MILSFAFYPRTIQTATPTELKDLEFQAQQAMELLSTCGSTQDYKPEKLMTFDEFVKQMKAYEQENNRFVVERIFTPEGRFHSFRPVNPKTIYQAVSLLTPQTKVFLQVFHSKPCASFTEKQLCVRDRSSDQNLDFMEDLQNLINNELLPYLAPELDGKGRFLLNVGCIMQNPHYRQDMC